MKEQSKLSLNQLISDLDKMFPNARCELDYNNLFELIIAVSLSSQTTDKRVNEVTKVLFSKYPTYNDLAKANIYEVEEILKPLGMNKVKAKNIIELSKKLIIKNKMPETLEELMELDGVGRKCANVILSEYYKIPSIAVDTHVLRTSNRLGLASGSVLEVEKKLMKKFDKKDWYFIHIHLVFLGRYVCKAKNKECAKCLINGCPSRFI
ncbi:MAG: endonuclease III [Acholeplasmatales bacterium]|nr:endonuclease III [Acholeplasmatales bacterium]